MSASLPPVIWICGAPGAGKSAAAWALFEQLAAAGRCVAHVDIDQLGMLYPESTDDPERHLLKAGALRVLLPGYAAAGAQVVVVSGVVDPQAGPDPSLLSDVDLTLCLLSPDPAVLRERILSRGDDSDVVDEALAEDAELRGAGFVDLRIDTSKLTVAETAARLWTSVDLPETAVRTPSPIASSSSGLSVVVITGARAAGSSTVGFGLALGRWRAGARTGFVDLQQLGLLARPGQAETADIGLALHQLAAMHGFLTTHGAGLLVVSGRLAVPDRAALRAVLPSAPVTVVRLEADSATIEAHVRERVAGSAARLAGDDLLGADLAQQAAVIAASLAEQEHFAAYDGDDAVLDVTGRTPADVVADVERLVEAEGE